MRPSTMRGPRCVNIGQMADVGGHRCHDDELVEIRIQMDKVDPPAGWLSVIPGAGPEPGRQAPAVRFSGWLGLLRVLYDATGQSGAGPAPGA